MLLVFITKFQVNHRWKYSGQVEFRPFQEDNSHYCLSHHWWFYLKKSYKISEWSCFWLWLIRPSLKSVHFLWSSSLSWHHGISRPICSHSLYPSSSPYSFQDFLLTDVFGHICPVETMGRFLLTSVKLEQTFSIFLLISLFSPSCQMSVSNTHTEMGHFSLSSNFTFFFFSIL